MARRNAYAVRYRMWGGDTEHLICVIASSAPEAWDTATYEEIVKKEGKLPYSAWVSSVTYQNGNVHYFNTCEGLPY